MTPSLMQALPAIGVDLLQEKWSWSKRQNWPRYSPYAHNTRDFKDCGPHWSGFTGSLHYWGWKGHVILNIPCTQFPFSETEGLINGTWQFLINMTLQTAFLKMPNMHRNAETMNVWKNSMDISNTSMCLIAIDTDLRRGIMGYLKSRINGTDLENKCWPRDVVLLLQQNFFESFTLPLWEKTRQAYCAT